MMPKSSEWMERQHTNYLISVVIYKDINNISLKAIKNKIHDVIYRKQRGDFSIDNGKASLKAKPLFPYDYIIDEPLTDKNYPDIMNDIPVDFDFMQHVSTVQPTKEKIFQKNFKFIAMKIPHHPKKRIISNLKSASMQFNKSFPNIIYVDISYITRGMKLADLDELEKDVRNFLKSNPSINTVVISNKYVIDNGGVPEEKNGIWVIHNSFAKHSAPASFRIPHEEDSNKEGLISRQYLDI